VPVRVAADVIAAPLQQNLQFLPPVARKKQIVSRPGGDDAAPAAETIRKHAGGEGVGFGGVIGIDDVEIARHQKGRSLSPRGQQEPGVTLAKRAPIDARQAARSSNPGRLGKKLSIFLSRTSHPDSATGPSTQGPERHLLKASQTRAAPGAPLR
jgi:hypothetical protein